MVEDTRRLTVRVKKEDAMQLKRMALENETNVSEILRNCIEKTIKNGNIINKNMVNNSLVKIHLNSVKTKPYINMLNGDGKSKYAVKNNQK